MRNGLIKLILLPIAVFIWIIGWTMSWAGSRKERETRQTQPDSAEEESITIMPMISEEPEQCET